MGKIFHLKWKKQLRRMRKCPRAPRLPATVIRCHRRVASGGIVWNFCYPASVCRWDWGMSGGFRISRTLMAEAGWRKMWKIGQTFSSKTKLKNHVQFNECLFALIDWLIGFNFRRVSHSVHLRAVFGRQTHVFHGGNGFKIFKKTFLTRKKSYNKKISRLMNGVRAISFHGDCIRPVPLGRAGENLETLRAHG